MQISTSVSISVSEYRLRALAERPKMERRKLNCTFSYLCGASSSWWRSSDESESGCVSAGCQCTVPVLWIKCGGYLFVLKSDDVNFYFYKRNPQKTKKTRSNKMYKNINNFIIRKATLKNPNQTVNSSMQVSMLHLTTFFGFPFQDMWQKHLPLH